MKIAHVNLAKGWGGGEIQTLTLIQTLRKAAPTVENIAVVRKGGEFAERLAGTGISFLEVSNYLQGHFSSELSEIDLLHAHDGRAPYWCRIHKFLKKTPYAITRRVPYPIKAHFAAKSAYANASALIALTSCIARSFPDVAVPRAIIPSSWLNNEVSEQKAAEIKANFPSDFLVAHLGSLTPVKNHKTTLETARILQTRNENVRFLILGKGSLEASLKKAAQDLKNVTWCGYREDISNWVRAADVVILPSLNEGLGSSLLEAYHQGKPVIGANVDGIPDVVTPETGFLIDPTNAGGLAEKILLMKNDNALYARLCAGAKTAADKYSPETNAKTYLEIYRHLFSRCKKQ